MNVNKFISPNRCLWAGRRNRTTYSQSHRHKTDPLALNWHRSFWHDDYSKFHDKDVSLCTWNITVDTLLRGYKHCRKETWRWSTMSQRHCSLHLWSTSRQSWANKAARHLPGISNCPIRRCLNCVCTVLPATGIPHTYNAKASSQL